MHIQHFDETIPTQGCLQRGFSVSSPVHFLSNSANISLRSVCCWFSMCPEKKPVFIHSPGSVDGKTQRNKAAQTEPLNTIMLCWCRGQGKGHGCLERKAVRVRGTVKRSFWRSTDETSVFFYIKYRQSFPRIADSTFHSHIYNESQFLCTITSRWKTSMSCALNKTALSKRCIDWCDLRHQTALSDGELKP